MERDSKESIPGSYRDDERGDVLVLDKSELPTLTIDRAIEWLRELGMPLNERQLLTARKRGKIVGSFIGRQVLFSKRELIDWVQSRRGAVSSRAKLENWVGR